jgi:hypothetical protein
VRLKFLVITKWDQLKFLRTCQEFGHPKFPRKLKLHRENSRGACQPCQSLFLSIHPDISPVPERNIKLPLQCSFFQVFKWIHWRSLILHSWLFRLSLNGCLLYVRILPHAITQREIIIVAFIYKVENWGMKWLPKITQLVLDRTGILFQMLPTPAVMKVSLFYTKSLF